MSVDPSISRAIVEEELAAMTPLAHSYGWQVAFDRDPLVVTVTMRSAIDSQVYIVEARCDGYRALPPYFEFIHPETGERGTQRCYPTDGSFFHPQACICVQWNRKSYAGHAGIHAEWDLAGWARARPEMNTLGDMFHLIQVRINTPGAYRGRMA